MPIKKRMSEMAGKIGHEYGLPNTKAAGKLQNNGASRIR
jgi:hypothetical protein